VCDAPSVSPPHWPRRDSGGERLHRRPKLSSICLRNASPPTGPASVRTLSQQPQTSRPRLSARNLLPRPAPRNSRQKFRPAAPAGPASGPDVPPRSSTGTAPVAWPLPDCVPPGQRLSPVRLLGRAAVRPCVQQAAVALPAHVRHLRLATMGAAREPGRQVCRPRHSDQVETLVYQAPGEDTRPAASSLAASRSSQHMRSQSFKGDASDVGGVPGELFGKARGRTPGISALPGIHRSCK